MQKFLRGSLRLIILISSGVILVPGKQNNIYAEGTKQLLPDSTISQAGLYIDNSPGTVYTNFAVANCPANYRLYIHVKNVGESILFGFETNYANVPFTLRKPNGTVAMTGIISYHVGQTGYIEYYHQAIVGPFPAYGGYSPFSYQVTSIADTGNYYFDIPTSITYPVEIEMWDFQVVSGQHNPAIPSDAINGRVWSQSWQLYASLGYGPSDYSPFNGSFYIYSDDGIVTKLAFSNAAVGAVTIFCNLYGCLNTGNFLTDRQSNNNNTFLTFPAIAQYKVFLNNPDSTLYPSGFYGKIVGTPYMIPDTAYPPCSGKKLIVVDVDKIGKVQVTITFPYGAPGTDVSLCSNVVPGINYIYWNGLDGLGNPVPDGTQLSVNVQYMNGLTNLPIWDQEMNPDGYIVTLVRPSNASGLQPPTFWDDSQLVPNTNGDPCNNPPQTVNFTGCTPGSMPGYTGCHPWQPVDGYCHNKMINTWWYGSTTNSPVLVYYSITPAPPVGNNVTRCGPGADTLKVTVVPSALTADWYNAATGGILLLSGSTTFVTPLLNTTTTFYADSRDPISGCISATRTPITVTINPLPVPTVTGPTLVCDNSSGNVYLTQAGMKNYTWSVSAGGIITSGGATTNNSVTVTWTSIGIQTVSVSYTNLNNCTAASPTVYPVTVDSPVSVIVQPSNSAVCNGSSTSFSVSATGTGLTFIWQDNTGSGWTNLSNGGVYSGVTTDSLIISSVTNGMNGYSYHCIINGSCSPAQTSNSALLTVNPIPTVTAAPPSQAICSTGTTNIVLSSTTGSTTYTWTINTVPAGSISGAYAGSGSFISQTLINTTAIPASVTYTVTPVANGCPGLPLPVVVTVNPVPNATATPAAQTICSTGTTNINLSSSIPSSTFTWTVAVSPAGSVTGALGGAGNAIVQTLTNGTPDPAQVTYTVTPLANGCPGSPVNVVVTVNPTPVAIAAPPFQTICSTGSMNIVLSSATPLTTFTWTTGIIPAGSVTGATAGSGDLISQTLVNTTALPANVTYTITPSATGCPGVPITSIVTVNPTPDVTATPVAQTICSGATSDIILSGHTPGTTFTWSASITPAGSVTGASAGSGNTIAQTLTNGTPDPAQVTYTVTPNANGCPGSPVNVIVTVNPTPVAIAAPPFQTICSTGSMNIVLSSATPLTTFTWTTSIIPAGSVTGATAGSGDLIAQTLVNTTALPANVTYTITPSADGCPGVPIASIVTVNPTPDVTATPVAQTICSGATSDIILSGPTPGTTFTWSASITPAGSVTGASAGSGSTIAQTLTNGTPDPALVTYTILPSANGCTGSSIFVVVTVNPKPVANAAPLSQTICSTGSMNIVLSSATPLTTFTWTTDVIPAGSVTGATAGSGDLISQTLVNTTSFTANVTYTVTPTANGCSGLPVTAAVTVYPLPVPVINGPSIVCINSNTIYSTAQGMTNYNWTVSGGTILGGDSTNAVTVKWNAEGSQTISVAYTDANGCNPATAISISITVSDMITTVTVTDATCYGADNGSAFVNVSGGIPGYTFLWNDPQAQTTNPATNLAPGTYMVTITDAALCTKTASVTILQKYPTPSASLTINSGDRICSGDSVILRFDLTGTPPWSLSYSDGATTTVVNGITVSPYIVQVYPANSCIYTITALTDAHCTAEPGMMQGSPAVSVLPLPAVEYTWQNGPQNNEVQFHIDSSITDLGAIGYMVLWNFGDGTFGYGHNPIHFYPGSTTFNCTLTVTDTSGCKNSVTHEIFVAPIPIAFYSSNAPSCLGNIMCFTDLSTVISPPAAYIQTWIWNFGDGTPPDTIHFPDNPNVCHLYSSLGNYQVSLTIRDNLSVSDTYIHSQAVIPGPVASFSYSMNCKDQPVQFTDASSQNGGGDIISWNWNFGDPGSGIYNISNLKDPTHIFATGNDLFNVTLIIQNFNGCRDTIIRPVYILPKPPVEFTHDSACDGQVVHYTADSIITHIDSIVTWSWNFGDGSQPVTNPITATHTYAAPGTYITTLTVTDIHGCINSVSHGIKVNVLPIARFSWSSPACSNSPVHFMDNSIIPPEDTGYIAKWLWDFGDGTSQLVVLPSSPDVMHTFAGTSMTHTVRLTVWTGDSCSQFAEHNIISIPSPIADFEVPVITCQHQSIHFTNESYSNGGDGIVQWNWNFGDPGSGTGNYSSFTNPDHTYNNQGPYQVRLIIMNQSTCSDTVIKNVTVNPSPVADFTADTACLDSPTTFTNLSIANADSIISSSWDFGDGTIGSTVPSPVHTFTTSGTFNVKLSVINSNGCQEDTTKMVPVHSLPVASFYNSSPNCSGTAVHYYDQSTVAQGQGSIVTWDWDFGDGTTLTIVAPASPDVTHIFNGNALSHMVRLTVTTSDNCAGFTEHTVNSIPSPVADFGFPLINCASQSVLFSDQSYSNGGGPVITWQWNFGDPVSGNTNTSSVQNPSHLFTGPGSYDVTLIISNVTGCSDTIVKTVVINTQPVANFFADTACLHQPTQFTDISTPNAPGIMTYSWDFGDGSQLSNIQDPIHTYASYGVMNVKLTVINSNGCTQDTTKQVVVRPLPLAEFTIGTADCHGSPIQFTDHSSVVPGDLVSIVQWIWNFGDGTSPVIIQYPGNPNITHLFTGPGNAYSVMLTVTTSDGCSGSISHTVYLVASPVAEFIYPDGTCYQQPVQFTDISQSNGGSNIIQWLWTFGDPVSGTNNMSSLQNPAHLFTSPGTYTVAEIIFNTYNCSDTSVNEVTVIPAPVADFTADTACLGSQTTFTDLSSMNNGIISQYLWDFGDGTTSTLKNPVHTYQINAIFQVRLTVTTQDGCSNDITKAVPVIPRPVVAFSASSPTCLGSAVQFTDNSFAMYGSIRSWTWNFGDGVIVMIVQPASPNISHLYANSGTYNVTLTVTTSSSCVSMTENPVPVQPLPTANFVSSPNKCELSPIQFTDMSQNNGGSPITQWIWNFDDPGSGSADTSLIPDPDHSFSAGGTYNIRLTVASEEGCIDSIIKPITVNRRPIAQFSSDSACANSATQFTDQSIPNAPGITSWHWNFGDPASGTNNTSSLKNPSHIYSASGNYLVTLTVINSNLCENDTVIQVPVSATPVAMFTFTHSCAKTPTQFTDESTSTGSQVISWHWDFGDGIGTSNIQDPIYTYSIPETYNVKLKVTNASGCTDSISIPVPSYPLPVAAFTYNSFFCPAGQVSFTNQSHGTGSEIAEQLWIFVPGSTSNLPDPSYVFPVTDTTYQVTLIVTDERGCRDTTTKSVFVKPGSSFAFTYDTVCFGNPTYFHAQNTTPGDSLYSLQWNFGDPASGSKNTSSLYNPAHIFSSPGTFQVRLKAWDSDNCANDVYKTVIIHALPRPGYSFVSPPCDNLTHFTDLSVPGSGVITSWTWNFGDGSPLQTIVSPGPGNTTHAYDIPGAYRASLMVTNSFGCDDTVSRLVSKPACITASFSQAASGTCTNAPVVFTDNSQPISQISRWHWTFGDDSDTSYTSYSKYIMHTYAYSGTYHVQLQVTTSVSQQIFTDTASSTVSTSKAPQTQFSAASVCFNKATMFKDLSNSFGTEITTWKWTFGDPSSGNNNYSDLPDPSHKYLRAGPYGVSLVVTNRSGCKDSLTKLTKVYILPVARFDNMPACSNNPTRFSDRSIVADTAIEYWNWSFGISQSRKDTSQRKDPAYTYKEAGEYNVHLIVRDFNGCSDTTDSIITVNPSPVSAFLYIDNLSGITGKIQLQNKSEGATGYYWDFGNGLTSTEEDPIVQYKEDGSYRIMLVSSNKFGCNDSTFLMYEMLFKGLFVPNAFVPASGIQGVNVFKPVGVNLREYTVEVFDPWGELLWKSTLLDSDGRPVESWNGRKSNGDYYQSGTYVWKINAIFNDGTIWEGSDVGKGSDKTIGTVTLIR